MAKLGWIAVYGASAAVCALAEAGRATWWSAAAIGLFAELIEA